MQSQDFEEKLQIYARLLVSLGVNLKQGQYVLISALTVHRKLALAIARAAYEQGASFVNILYQDEKLERLRLEYTTAEMLDFFSAGTIQSYKEILEKRGVFISISTREDLDIFEQITAERNSRLLLARAKAFHFFNEKIKNNEIKWCVGAAATPGLAKVLFPKLPILKAQQKLWAEIFKICRIDKPDPVSAWQRHVKRLQYITRKLNELSIKTLLFKGPHLDLSIGLDKKARWMGGQSISQDKEIFLPNIPTEEVFSVPDYKRTDGWVNCTRPLVYKNIFVEHISLGFEKGILKNIKGSEGIESLRQLLFDKPENSRVGEVALVEISSPVYKSGYVFHDLLYDENAASHIALGAAYPECLADAEKFSDKEKEAHGFNQSKIHIDLMIGEKDVTVKAELYNGKEVIIMEKGVFVI